MSLNDVPYSVGLHGPVSVLPEYAADIQESVRADVSERIESDSILSDVFLIGQDGKFRVNRASAILSGHFEGMPIVPGVVSKLLAGKFLRSDLYSAVRKEDGSRLAWKTEFPWAITNNSDGLEFVLEEGKYLLKSKGKTFATFELDEHSDREISRMNFAATHTKDVYFEAVSAIPADDPENFVLQSDPFRFVTTGGELGIPSGKEKPVLLWGYFHVPDDFIFIDGTGNVHAPIVEESVAQIASMAYAKTRGFPAIRENGRENPKAQVLTFKSSLAEWGKGILVRWDQLTVAIEILEEEGRTVKFAYEAWNCAHATVLSGTIEGTCVPLKLLKRMVS